MLICLTILVSFSNKIISSPLNWAVHTQLTNHRDYQGYDELPGLNEDDYFVDDYEDYLNQSDDDLTDFNEITLDYQNIKGKSDLIDDGNEIFGQCPIDNKCQQGCIPSNSAKISDSAYNCTCWPGFELLCDGYSCGESYDEPMPSFSNDGSCPEGFIPLGGRFDKTSTKSCFFLGNKKGPQAKAKKYRIVKK